MSWKIICLMKWMKNCLQIQLNKLQKLLGILLFKIRIHRKGSP